VKNWSFKGGGVVSDDGVEDYLVGVLQGVVVVVVVVVVVGGGAAGASWAELDGRISCCCCYNRVCGCVGGGGG